MNITSLGVIDIARFIKVDLNDNSANELRMLKDGAVAYVSSYTKLSKEKLDEYEDLTIAVLIIIAEMFENRTFTVESDSINPIAKSILDLHDHNF